VINSNLGPLAPFSHNTSVTDDNHDNSLTVTKVRSAKNGRLVVVHLLMRHASDSRCWTN